MMFSCASKDLVFGIVLNLNRPAIGLRLNDDCKPMVLLGNAVKCLSKEINIFSGQLLDLVVR
jgi:hypothetical protein